MSPGQSLVGISKRLINEDDIGLVIDFEEAVAKVSPTEFAVISPAGVDIAAHMIIPRVSQRIAITRRTLVSAPSSLTQVLTSALAGFNMRLADQALRLSVSAWKLPDGSIHLLAALKDEIARERLSEWTGCPVEDICRHFLVPEDVNRVFLLGNVEKEE